MGTINPGGVQSAITSVVTARAGFTAGDYPSQGTPLANYDNATAANILTKITDLTKNVRNASFQEGVQLILSRKYSGMLNSSPTPEIEKKNQTITAVNGAPMIKADTRRMYPSIAKGTDGYTGAGGMVAVATARGAVQRIVSYEASKIIDPSVNHLAIAYGTFVPKYKIPAVGAIVEPALP